MHAYTCTMSWKWNHVDQQTSNAIQVSVESQIVLNILDRWRRVRSQARHVERSELARRRCEQAESCTVKQARLSVWIQLQVAVKWTWRVLLLVHSFLDAQTMRLPLVAHEAHDARQTAVRTGARAQTRILRNRLHSAPSAVVARSQLDHNLARKFDRVRAALRQFQTWRPSCILHFRQKLTVFSSNKPCKLLSFSSMGHWGVLIVHFLIFRKPLFRNLIYVILQATSNL